MNEDDLSREDKVEMLKVVLDITADGEHLDDLDRASLQDKVAQLGVGQNVEIVPEEETSTTDNTVQYVDFRKHKGDK